MAHALAQCLWLALPVVLAGILHMVVVKKDWLPGLKRPVDGGLTLGGERLFGDNKTWRGFVVMIALSALLGAIQGLLGGGWWGQGENPWPIDYPRIEPVFGELGPVDNYSPPHLCALMYTVVSAVAGLGYALGELPNSFLKRRVKIEPGKTGSGALGAVFFVLDQGDSVFAALGLVWLVFGCSLTVLVTGVVTLTLIHLALNWTLYFLRVRKNL